MKKALFILSLLLLVLAVTGQDRQETVSGLTARYVGKIVLLSYKTPVAKGIRTADLKLYRSSGAGAALFPVSDIKGMEWRDQWDLVDSTIGGEGIYQYVLAVYAGSELLTKDSVLVNAFAPGTIPGIRSFDASSEKGSDKVTVRWSIAKSFLVRSASLYRSRKMNEGFVEIKTFSTKDTVYTEQVTDANEPFFYQLKLNSILTDQAFSSPVVFVVPSFMIQPLRPGNVRAMLGRDRPSISWSSNDPASRGFYLLKKGPEDAEFYQASGLILSDSAQQYNWVDTNKNLLAGNRYQYAVVAESNSYTKSIPSDTVSLFLPLTNIALAPPMDLRISRNEDSAFVLIWNIDSLRKQPASEYIVYFKKAADSRFTAVTNGIATEENNFITIPEPANGDTYQVTARLNDKESIPSTPVVYVDVTERSFGPAYIKGEIVDDQLFIHWNNETAGAKEFRLYKWNDKAYSLIETIGGTKNSVQVKNYIAGEMNLYVLRTVNRKNIESDATSLLTIY